MSEHELLIRHAERWAADKNRPFEAELVELVLDLRATHDALPANQWPTGSVEHVMLRRWPAHGPAGVPDVAALVQSLDTFWRFLRSTGRMAGASADPKVLLAEAKKAAKKMPAACTEPENYSATKSILDFGAEIGISLEGAESEDELNDRLQQIMEAWNAQPDEVRMSRPMGAGSAGSVMGQALGEAADSMVRTGDVPPGWAMPSPPRLDGLDFEDEFDDDRPLFPNDPAVSAPYAKSSDYLRQVFALADFSDGKELTSAGYLRPAIAREAYEHLDLWEWDSRMFRSHGVEPHEGHRRRALHGWRSARDCVALDRLWAAVVGAQLVDNSGRRAVRLRDDDPVTDLDWVGFALAAGLGEMGASGNQHPVAMVLMTLLAVAEPYGGGPLTVTELAEFRFEALRNRSSDPAALTAEVEDSLRRMAESLTASLIANFDDLGWWAHRKGRLKLTPLGWDMTLALVTAMDGGLF